MARSVLVTGGAGYIGSVVVEQLVARGYGVVVLDDLSRGHREAVDSRARFVHGGVGDRSVLEAVFARESFDTLVHLAAFALVAESVAEPEKYVANNITAGAALLTAAERAGVHRVVFSSSCAVYGHPLETPITEAAPLRPVNPYGETKRAFELLLERYASAGHAAVSLRYFNAAGASARHGEHHEPETHLIPNVLAVALGRRPALDLHGTDYATADGTAVRDYIHVHDIADAHVRAIEADLRGASAVNLGTGTGYSVRAVVEAARRVTGRPIPTLARARRPGDPPALVAATGRAAELLGWRPRHSALDAILTSAWAWHQAHPDGYRNARRL